MILHVDGVNAVCGIDLPHSDVIGAIADFHRAAKGAVITADIVNQHVSYASSVAAAAADGNNIAANTAHNEVPDDPANDVAVFRSLAVDHDAILGTVGHAAAFDAKVSCANNDERRADTLRNGLGIAHYFKVRQRDAF